MSAPRRISASQLRAWMDRGDQVAIVDVRDGDRVGGHIKSSINVPSSNFYNQLPKLQTGLASRQRVVFHCQLSQQRGPTCAAAYSRQLAQSGTTNQEVYVLSGGFNEWAHKYGQDPNYTEGFCSDIYQ